MSLRTRAAFALLPLACGTVLGEAEETVLPPSSDAGVEASPGADASPVTDAGVDGTALFDLTFEDGLVNSLNGAEEATGMILAAMPINGTGSAETTGAGATLRKRIPARDGDVFVAFDARLEDGGAGIAEMYAGGVALFGVAVGTGDGRVATYGGSGGATDGGVVERGSTVRFGIRWTADAGAGIGAGYRVYVAGDGGFTEPLVSATLGDTARPDAIAIGSIASDLRVVIDDVRGDEQGFR